MNEDELKYALNAHAAFKSRELWMKRLSRASGLTIDDEAFLGIEDTGLLKSKLLTKLRDKQSSARVCFETSSIADLCEHLTQLAARIGSCSVILFHSEDLFFGAVKIPLDVVLSHFTAVWREVQDDLSVLTPDASSGLCLERNFYDLAGQYCAEGVYELITWGDFKKRQEADTIV